jgi:hypothetical protein
LIGFVLPATVFMLALKVIDVGFDIKALDVSKDADVLGIIIIPFAILFIAILLLALNRPIVRTIEGYGRLNPFRPLLRRIFMEKIQPVLDEKKRLDEARKISAGVQSEMLHFSKRLRRSAGEAAGERSQVRNVSGAANSAESTTLAIHRASLRRLANSSVFPSSSWIEACAAARMVHQSQVMPAPFAHKIVDQPARPN